LRASEQDREDVAAAREEWRGFQARARAERLVFLDETAVKTNMARLYGRAPRGRRCHDRAPCGRWERVTLLSAVRLDGSTESMVFGGATDRRAFDEYMRRVLGPTLGAGDVLVLDNLSVHKSAEMLKIAAGRGAEVRFLPPYSPDLNPIEKMWSKVKQTLRGIKARTDGDLLDAIGTALGGVTASDACGWFKSCGYVLSQS
jgi:transposase